MKTTGNSKYAAQIPRLKRDAGKEGILFDDLKRKTGLPAPSPKGLTRFFER